MEQNKVQDLLNQRGANYGSYEVGTENFAKVMETVNSVHKDKNGCGISKVEELPIMYIVMKLIRLAATPNHLDSWVDIQGYAKLAEDMYTPKTMTQEELNAAKYELAKDIKEGA